MQILNPFINTFEMGIGFAMLYPTDAHFFVSPNYGGYGDLPIPPIHSIVYQADHMFL